MGLTNMMIFMCLLSGTLFCAREFLPPILEPGATYFVPEMRINFSCGSMPVGKFHILYALTPTTYFNIVPDPVDRTYPYRLHRCSCRHYTDYLLYGKTFGNWWDLKYMPISSDCPLHGPLTSESDVSSIAFKLYDLFGNSFDLNPPPSERSFSNGFTTDEEYEYVD